ncbi:MAG: cyclic nucleotide-binding domain-containing protein [Spirochaetales bacterium]|nr:cyclic nucleotide-binding domain-containing protein [Spirochaetales bacterium]
MKELSIMDFIDHASSMLLFKALSKNELEKIFSAATAKEYANNEKIIAKGEISPSLFVVLEGTVNVSVPHGDAQPVFICSIGKGDVFGEAGIFLKVGRTADVIAADNTVLFEITRDSLIGFIRQNPEAGIKILMLIIYSLLRKLKEANQELAFERKADISQKDIDSIVSEVMG